MGKKIDELTFVEDGPVKEPDSRDTTWGRFLAEIEELRSDPDYGWAEESLSGIAETVEKKRWVTEGQRTAVANIKAGIARRRFGQGRRRYEGWAK